MTFTDGKFQVTATKRMTRYGERWHIQGAFQGKNGRWVSSDAKMQAEIAFWEANEIYKVPELA